MIVIFKLAIKMWYNFQLYVFNSQKNNQCEELIPCFLITKKK